MTKIKLRLLRAQSDERLAHLVQAGDEPAFEALVNRYRKPLLRYCQRLCNCDARAEEALQQALLNAWMALRSETEIHEPRAWLYRVTRNAAINSMRAESHQAEADTDRLDGALSPVASPARIEEAIELRETLADVAALPQMQREVMVRAALAGHSHEEVASELGISDDAVRGLLYRARARLRTSLTAITPAPLLAWASSGLDQGAGASGARIGEIAAGGGTAGLAGLVMKAGAVALTAGVVVSGVVANHDRRPSPSRDRTQDLPVASRQPGLVTPRPQIGVQEHVIPVPHARRMPIREISPSPTRHTPSRETSSHWRAHQTPAPKTSPASHTRPTRVQVMPTPSMDIAHQVDRRSWEHANQQPSSASSRPWQPDGAASDAAWNSARMHAAAPDSPPLTVDQGRGGSRDAENEPGNRWASRAAKISGATFHDEAWHQDQPPDEQASRGTPEEDRGHSSNPPELSSQYPVDRSPESDMQPAPSRSDRHG